MDESAAAGGVSVRNGQESRVLGEGVLDRVAACAAASLRSVQARYLERVRAPSEIAIVLIDDAEIARVHGEFMGDPTPTDVITFPYGGTGEILISIETAERNALEYGVSLEREVALYAVHGVLHLCGYEDAGEEEREEMARLQEELVAANFREG